MSEPSKLPPLVSVDWLDSHCSTGWHLAEGFTAKAITCRSVGYLVFHDDETTAVAPHLVVGSDAVEQQFNGVMTIPTRCVVRVIGLLESATFSDSAASRSAASVLGQAFQVKEIWHDREPRRAVSIGSA